MAGNVNITIDGNFTIVEILTATPKYGVQKKIIPNTETKFTADNENNRICVNADGVNFKFENEEVTIPTGVDAEAKVDSLKSSIEANDGIIVNTNPNLDAFGRDRVSGTGQRLDVEFIYNKMPELFDEMISNGTVTHNANTRDLTMALSDANDGSYATMRSHPIPYTPGNSQLQDITGVLDFANIGTGTVEVFLRSNISGTPTDIFTETQANWDNFTSGLDWSKSFIFAIDFQSLKVGSIRYNINRNGKNTLIHQQNNDFVRDSGYWQLPSIPAFWRIYTTGGITYMEMGYGDENNAIGIRYKVTANANATMKAICVTVKSEGGIHLQDMAGLPGSKDLEQTSKTVSTTLIPLISFKMKSTFNSLPNMAIALMKGVTWETNQSIRLVLIQGGTLTGSTFVDVNVNYSAMEYDITASAIANGRQLKSFYVSASGNNRESSGQGLLGKAVLWDRKHDTETGIFSICAVRTGTNDADVMVGGDWDEIR